jgi:hypothetical protein
MSYQFLRRNRAATNSWKHKSTELIADCTHPRQLVVTVFLAAISGISQAIELRAVDRCIRHNIVGADDNRQRQRGGPVGGR